MRSEGARGTADLTVLVSRVPGGRRALARDLARLAAYVAKRYEREVQLSFVVLDDERMADMHQRFGKREGPTDVLAFPLADEPILVGEVLVSADTARREATRRGHPAYDEILLYAVHGVMHLVGHDDHEPADRRRMRRAEREALAALGRTSVYSHSPSSRLRVPTEGRTTPGRPAP